MDVLEIIAFVFCWKKIFNTNPEKSLKNKNERAKTREITRDKKQEANLENILYHEDRAKKMSNDIRQTSRKDRVKPI